MNNDKVYLVALGPRARITALCEKHLAEETTYGVTVNNMGETRQRCVTCTEDVSLSQLRADDRASWYGAKLR